MNVLRGLSRRSGSLSVAMLALVLYFYQDRYDRLYWDSRYLTGWFLSVALLILTLHAPRKFLCVLPLGPMHLWRRLHVLTGWLALALLILHLPGRLPDGVLEAGLGGLIVLVLLGGLAGQWLGWYLPRRLARRGEEVLFERIPLYRRQLADEAQELIRQCLQETGSTTLPDFYRRVVHAYLAAPRNRFAHLVESSRPLARLRQELRELDRYADDRERVYLARLEELIRRKTDLDYHYALQGALKVWSLLHGPLVYALWPLVLLHGVLAYGFRSG
ncbi:MAG: hypothetical protein HQL56_12550 [Magnetococcales bacterium]|nr:hypothetical protein [Magnetococcales bacterium]